MSDRWTERLSEYLDGNLAAEEREPLARHLESCAECAAALADLGRVVERARALGERPPARDLWPGIAARLSEPAPADEAPAPLSFPAVSRRPTPRRVSLSWAQLAAAGLAVALLSAAAAWLLRPGPRPIRLAGGQDDRSGGMSAATPAASRDRSYDEAITELRRALSRGRGELDTTTVRILEQNLALIERSIDQARRALAADPANPYLRQHLQDTMRRKIELLRRATVVASAG